MAEALPVINDCCSPCDSEGSVATTPGPEGPAGADGADGTDGINALTTVAVNAPPPQPVMPAGGFTVTVNTTSSTAWMAVGQILFVQNWGYMEVTAIPSSTSVTLLNPETGGLYSGNSGAGTSLAAANRIVPGGVQGPGGVAPVGALLSANNLNDVGSAALSRGFLGLGTIATQAASAVAITGGSITGITDLAVADGGTGASNAAGAQNNLGLVPGLDVQAFDAGLQSFSALPTIADRYPYSTAANVWAEGAITALARTLLDDSSQSAMHATLGVMVNYGLIVGAVAVNVNALGDTSMALPANIAGQAYRIDKVIVTNASLSLTLATAGVFTAAGGGGTTIAADQVLSALTANTKFLDLTLQPITGTDVFTATTLYFRIGTVQGAAGTVNAYVFGYKIP